MSARWIRVAWLGVALALFGVGFARTLAWLPDDARAEWWLALALAGAYGVGCERERLAATWRARGGS